MAFRINYRGALIEGDSAQDVGDLMVVLASALPRQLTAATPVGDPGVSSSRTYVGIPLSEPAAVKGRKSAKKSVAKVGGGVARTRAAGGGVDLVADPVLGRVLQAVSVDGSKLGDVASAIGQSRDAVRVHLYSLIKAGRVRAEGATVSRRYFAVASRHGRQSAAPAKEAVR